MVAFRRASRWPTNPRTESATKGTGVRLSYAVAHPRGGAGGRSSAAAVDVEVSALAGSSVRSLATAGVLVDIGLEVSDRDGWTVLTVTGEVDVATAPRLREQLIRLVSDERYRIVVDLGAVDFIDSTGLGVLIGALKRVRSHDGDLMLICSEPRVLRVFEITGLDRVFTIHPSLDLAVAG